MHTTAAIQDDAKANGVESHTDRDEAGQQENSSFCNPFDGHAV